MYKTFRDLLILAALVGTVGVVGPLTTIPAVVNSARDVAAGRPYCIDVPEEPERRWYEPAQSIFDLGALRMHARLGEGGLFPIFHAVLYVEDNRGARPQVVLYNWSYAGMRFMRIEGQGHSRLNEVSQCTRHPDFIEHLLGAP